MNAITLPKRPDLTDVVPLSSSPDGQLNSFCMRCEAQGQSMSYAACLWRQGVLSKPDIRTPADWAPCGEAARHGTCVALMMRKEEEVAEQSIYFRKRLNEAHPLAEPKRAWHTPVTSMVKSTVTAAGAALGLKSPPAAKPRDAIDAMGLGGVPGGYADAITEMVKTGSHVTSAPAFTPPAAPAVSLGENPVALPGESPLAMARRLAAARAAAIAAK
jgi:hypothetical protein